MADGDGRDVAIPDEAGIAPAHRTIAETVGVGRTGTLLIDGEDRGQEESKDKDKELCLLNADHHNINIDVVQSAC